MASLFRVAQEDLHYYVIHAICSQRIGLGASMGLTGLDFIDSTVSFISYLIYALNFFAFPSIVATKPVATIFPWFHPTVRVLWLILCRISWQSNLLPDISHLQIGIIVQSCELARNVPR